MKRSVRKSFKWLWVLGMIAGLLAALLPTGPAAAATLSFSTTRLPTATGMVVSNTAKGNVMAVSPNYASDSRIWVALDKDPIPAGGDGNVDEVAYSSNGGTTWTAIDPSGSDTDPIVAIVPSPLYASDNTILVASTTRVYWSTNGGSSYTQLGAEQGAGNLAITSLAVSPNYNGIGEVAIGLADTAAGVAACPTGPLGDDDCVRVWGRGNVLNWASVAANDMAADVTSIAYSPSFSADGVMMVIGSATTAAGAAVAGTALYHVIGTSAGWNTGTFTSIVINAALTDVGAATDGIVSSALAVAPDYDGSDNARRVVYVGTNSPRTDDGIFRVTSTSGTRRSAGNETDVSNIAIAGSASSPRVLFSDAAAANGNAAYLTTNFTSGSSAPTINTRRPVPGAAASAATGTTVGLSPDGDTAFALVSSALGGNGGFSRSADGGNTFGQISLLNNVGAFTDTGATIAGFAVSPNFETSGHMVAVAAGASADVTLYSTNGGANWTVRDTGTLTIDSVAFAYSPNFATDNTIYSADLGSNKLERSTNGGLSWGPRSSVACGTSNVTSIAAADGSTIFVGCSNGSVRKSVNGGFLFSSAGGTGSGVVADIALSPSYATDNSILIGQTSQARLSTNGGSSFSGLGTSGPGSGATQVAFHSDYATNNMVYAGNTDVYRWTVGTSTSWLRISGAMAVVGLGSGADGTLYVASGAPFASGVGGIFTSATPTASSIDGVGLAQVRVTTAGTDLVAGDTVGGFAHASTAGSERVWVSITDSATSAADNWRHYTDTIGSRMRPDGLSPADGAVVGTSNAAGSGITGFSIGWNAVPGATQYNYEWSTSSTFAEPCAGAPASSRRVAESAICDTQTVRPGNTTYYWRVRVAAPVVGPYSATQSLTTSLIAGESAGLPELSQPNAGNLADATSREVPLRPLFVWTAVNSATNYELQVSTDGTFLDPNQMVVDRSGSTRLGNQIAFQSDVQLAPGTVYFWRVRGVSATSQGGYPPAAAFTTTSAAAATGRPAGTALITLEAAGNLEVVTGYDYASGLWQSYVPGLPGNTLTTIQPNSVLFITVTEDTTVIVSGVAYNISANTPTPVPVGAAVTIAVQ